MPEMNLNALLIDQRVTGMIESHPDFFKKWDNIKKKSLAFVLLCIKTTLNISDEEAMEKLTDDGNDCGVDGIDLQDIDDNEFTVTLFQGKYRQALDGTANFPENAVKQAINTVLTLFAPEKEITMNDKIRPVIEEIRSRVRDGMIPTIRFLLCSNGKKWNNVAEQDLRNANLPKDQVTFCFYNHDDIVKVFQSPKKINDSLQLKGKAIIEDFNYRRVLIGKMPVLQIKDFFDRHGDLLLDRNIRRYLGLHSNTVNSAISNTLKDDRKRENFYFFNNGITIVCDKFRYNALQGEDYSVQIDGLQIINGGQTCKTIQKTLEETPELKDSLGNTYVLIRLYELDAQSKDFINDITYATNSQNPVNLRDLHANDEIQRQLELGFKDLGYVYKRKRDDSSSSNPNVIPSSIVAEAVLAIFRQKPHQAKFSRKELFGKLYNYIFQNLNPAQALFAVLIFRFVENERKRPTLKPETVFLPYASHFLAMKIGQLFCKNNNLASSDIIPSRFKELADKFEHDKNDLYLEAVQAIDCALKKFYAETKLSLQQLSATFRRGDLIETLLQ